MYLRLRVARVEGRLAGLVLDRDELRRVRGLLRRVGDVGTGDGQFRLPGGLVFTKSGELLACDQGNSRMQEIYQHSKKVQKRNSELTSENASLRRELRRVQNENNTFHLQDDFNAALIQKLPIGTARSGGSDMGNTVPRNVFNQPMANASLGAEGSFGNLSESL